MRRKVRRLAAAGGIAVATLLAVGGGLAANLVTSAEHWPRPLEWLRTHPWTMFIVFTAAVVIAQVWLWWPQTRATTVTNAGPVRRIVRLPPRHPHFTGREGLLDELHAALADGRPVAVVALRGLGGVGKTQLATEYAHRHSERYDLAWWIDAEQAASIPVQFGQLARALGLPEADSGADDVDLVTAELRRRGRWMLIFDNAERVDDLAGCLPGGDGHVLITSRTSGWGEVGATLEVDVLTRAESVALLASRAANEHDALEEIAGLLGDLPLALEQAASFMEKTGASPAEYLSLLRARPEAMFARGRATHHSGTVETVWSLSVDRLVRENPAAVALLRICAFLGPEPIPLDLFSRNVSLLPPVLSSTAVDPLAFTEAVGALATYSLVRRRHHEVSVHRLVQATTRTHLDATEQEATSAVALALLHAELEVDDAADPQRWSRWQALLPHVLAATGHTQAGPGLVPLLSGAALFLRVRGTSAAALPLLERALATDLARYGPDHPEVASRLVSLGVAFCDGEQYGRARQLLQQALVINESVLGNGNPAVANNLNMLALALAKLGETTEALELIKRGVEIDTAVLDPDDWRHSHDRNVMALILRKAGDRRKARELLELALADYESRYGANGFQVAIILRNLAGVLLDEGLATEAVPLLRRALEIDTAAFGAGHPRTARNATLLAEAVEAGPILAAASREPPVRGHGQSPPGA